MKKIFSLLLLSAFISMNSLSVMAALPANTPVTIQSNNTYSSATLNTADEVNFSVAQDVSDSLGKVVIKAGTPVKSTVKLSQARKRIGRPGEIVIGDFSTTATNGQKIPLSGQISTKAKSKMGLSIALSVVIIPFFLLMKGKDAQINQGSQFVVYTAN